MKNRDEVLLEIEQVLGTSSPEDLIEVLTWGESYWNYNVGTCWSLEYTDYWRLRYDGTEFYGDSLRETVDQFHEYLFEVLRGTGCEVEVTYGQS